MKKLTFLLITLLWGTSQMAIAQNNTDALFPFLNAAGKWGYVNAQQKVIIPHSFEGASPFFEERAFVMRKLPNKPEPVCSVIDTKGKILFDEDFINHAPMELCQNIYHRYSDGLLYIPDYSEANTKQVFYDKQGKVALTINSKYPATTFFSEGLIYIQDSDSTWIYVDKQGKTVLQGKGDGSPLEYGFHSGWTVKRDPNYQVAFMNKKGEIAPFMKSLTLTDAAAMHEGYALIALPDTQDPNNEIIKVLSIDGTTKPVALHLEHSSPVTSVSGYNFSNGLVLVRYFDKNKEGMILSGYLNTEGRLAFVLPAILQTKPYTEGQNEFETITGSPFHEGLACWRIEKSNNHSDVKFCKVVYISTKGKIVFESPFVKVK